MKKKLRSKWWLKSAAFALLLLCWGTARGEGYTSNSTHYTITDASDYRRFNLAIEPGAFFAEHNGQSLSGTGLGLDLGAAFSRTWAAEAALHEAFSPSSGFSALYTELDLKLEYAITGSLERETHWVKTGNEDVFREVNSDSSGLRVGIVFTDYLFNAATSVISFTGVGGTVSYEFASNSNVSYSLGARVDIISNGSITLFPIRPFLRIGFWL